ncbi:hypothetical protein E2C01_067663 [Portunus trituberculatus]|uniref:Uncharacterized protein n=1 Tax=Portunus trituberculatus TaxID=210409 RepID=A0A5B7HU97_PORTR|nr:hypothetical protein [Portunus trituberculatus]
MSAKSKINESGNANASSYPIMLKTEIDFPDDFYVSELYAIPLTPQPPWCTLIAGLSSSVDLPALAHADWPRDVVLSLEYSSPVFGRAAQTVSGMPPRPPTHQTQPVCAGRMFHMHARRIPQVRRLRPAATIADITGLRGCVGAERPCPAWPHVLKDCFSREHCSFVTSLTSSTLLLTTSVRPLHCSHCHQFFLELFRQILPQPLAVFQATKFSSLFQPGLLSSGLSLPLASKSAMVHTYPATLLIKPYPTAPDTNCYAAHSLHSLHSRDRDSLTTVAAQGNTGRVGNRHGILLGEDSCLARGTRYKHTPQTQTDSLRETGLAEAEGRTASRRVFWSQQRLILKRERVAEERPLSNVLSSRKEQVAEERLQRLVLKEELVAEESDERKVKEERASLVELRVDRKDG